MSCQVCNQEAHFRCSGCKLIKYCSYQCQRIDWINFHKNKCYEYGLQKYQSLSDAQKLEADIHEAKKSVERLNLEIAELDDGEYKNWKIGVRDRYLRMSSVEGMLLEIDGVLSG